MGWNPSKTMWDLGFLLSYNSYDYLFCHYNTMLHKTLRKVF